MPGQVLPRDSRGAGPPINSKKGLQSFSTINARNWRYQKAGKSKGRSREDVRRPWLQPDLRRGSHVVGDVLHRQGRSSEETAADIGVYASLSKPPTKSGSPVKPWPCQATYITIFSIQHFHPNKSQIFKNWSSNFLIQHFNSQSLSIVHFFMSSFFFAHFRPISFPT